MRSKVKTASLLKAALAAGFLASCSETEEILPGERFSILTPLSQSNRKIDDPTARPDVVNRVSSHRAAAIDLPAPRDHPEWRHRNGSVRHAVEHPALGDRLSELWSVDIGEGNSRRLRATASPVVFGGRVYTMDAFSNVIASDLSGNFVWGRELTPLTENLGDASGGGLSVGDGKLFVTTGFGDLFALSLDTGETTWQHRFKAPVGSGAVYSGRTVFVIPRDNSAWALDSATGRVRWWRQSVDAVAVLTGGASPAASGRQLVLPFSSGEVVSVVANSGVQIWSSNVTGSRSGYASAIVSDIASDPVLSGGSVYVSAHGGGLVALNLANGSERWVAEMGTLNPVWPAGGSVFMVSDSARLVRLSARTGRVIWSVELPEAADMNLKSRRGVYLHFGPVVAGDLVWVASGDGLIRGFDPVSGDLVSTAALPGGASSSPAVVNGVMYIVDGDGVLRAFG